MRPVSLALGVAAIGASIVLTACGSDSTAPSAGQVVNFPGDAATLQGAIDKAGAGDVVVVADGQHTVNATVTIPAAKSGLILKGADGTRPSLVFAVDPINEDAIVVQARGVSVRSLEISGAFRTGVSYVPGGAAGGGGDVSDCVIRDAADFSVECGSPAADITVQRNILLDPGSFGVLAQNGALPIIQNNTIVGANDCAIYMSQTSPECRRNILVQSNVYGIACFTAQAPVLSCNVLFDNGSSDYSFQCVPGDGDQHADPMFCDTSTFTLLPGSPCAPANAGACQGIGAVETVCSP